MTPVGREDSLEALRELVAAVDSIPQGATSTEWVRFQAALLGARAALATPSTDIGARDGACPVCGAIPFDVHGVTRRCLHLDALADAPGFALVPLVRGFPMTSPSDADTPPLTAEAVFTEAVNAPSATGRGIAVPHYRDVEAIWAAISPFLDATRAAQGLREALTARHAEVCACPFDGSDDGCNLTLTGAELSALVSQPEAGIDVAWAEAEAALPEGWRMAVQRTDEDFAVWAATGVSPAFFEGENEDEYADGQGPTPAAALHALAARLTAPGKSA